MVKDKECLHCEKLFDCAGKEKGKLCLQYKERKQRNDDKFKTERRTL